MKQNAFEPKKKEKHFLAADNCRRPTPTDNFKIYIFSVGRRLLSAAKLECGQSLQLQYELINNPEPGNLNRET
jgi:hypothetical protein